MKVSAVLLTLALALVVSAAPQQQKQNAIQNKGGAQNQQNNKNGQNGQAQNGKNGQNNNNNNGKGNNNNNAGGAANNGGKGSSNANATSTDPQTSLTLDPAVISKGFENNGQDVPTAGQVASLTSPNNFINFCLTVPNLPLTNGQQVTGGSCNTAPMGIIPSTDNMPSCKFVSPKNGDVIKSNTPFTITMAISNLETGNFVNAQENYFAAPQQTNGQGQVKGHSHVVVESLTSFQQTTPTNPKVFAFFKGLNDAAVGGQLTASVASGLPAGTYKLSSINTAANHQPVLVPIAQHGSLDDAVYFSITDDGKPPANNVLAPPAAANTTQASQNNNQAAQGGNKANQASQAGGNKAAANNNQAAQQNGQKAGQQNGGNNNNKQASQQNNAKNGQQNNGKNVQQNNGNKNQQQNQNQQKGQQQNQQNNNQQKGQNGGKGKRSSPLRL